MLSCPFANGGSCKKDQCGVYNPVIKGCGLMCTALPMGEEICGCRKELAEISGHLASLVNVLLNNRALIVDALEEVASAAQNQADNVDQALCKLEEISETDEYPQEVLE